MMHILCVLAAIFFWGAAPVIFFVLAYLDKYPRVSRYKLSPHIEGGFDKFISPVSPMPDATLRENLLSIVERMEKFDWGDLAGETEDRNLQ